MPRLFSRFARQLPLAIAVLACIPLPAPAEDKPGEAMIDKYLAAEAARLSQRFLDGAKTVEEWQAKRLRLKQEYLDMLGLWPGGVRDGLAAHRSGGGPHYRGKAIAPGAQTERRGRCWVGDLAPASFYGHPSAGTQACFTGL
jgi:hypothetical protein